MKIHISPELHKKRQKVNYLHGKMTKQRINHTLCIHPNAFQDLAHKISPKIETSILQLAENN